MFISKETNFSALASRSILAAMLCLVVGIVPVLATEIALEKSPRYFYRGLGFGSDATFHPVSELINGSFGLLQISSNWRPLDEIDFRRGLDITWESIIHPIRTVNERGQEEFLTSEVVPTRLGWRDLQFLPNWHLHLVGGGARHRAFSEWYDAHGFARPGLWAWLTTTIHAFGVEMVEHHGAPGPTADPVADMLIFDPAGALLFSTERVSRFFARTLNLAIWSGQPMYNPAVNTFENLGQNYGLHYFFGDDDRVGIFSYWGMSDLIGVTVRGDEGLDWSLGLGGLVEELRENEETSSVGDLYARVKWDVGAFFHRDNSLLASIHFSESWTQRLRVNVFPGVFEWRGVSPGLFAGVRSGDFIVGLSIRPIPVGLAVSE